MLVSSPVWLRTPAVIGLLAVLMQGGPGTAAAEEIAGTSGRIAWRLTDLALGKTSIGGKDHATYSFNLVLRNVGPGALTLARYETRLVYAGFLTSDVETASSGRWVLPPAGDMTLGLQSALACVEGAGECRPPVGPTWTVVLLGSDHEGKALRQVLTFTLPPVPGQPVPPPTRVARAPTAGGTIGTIRIEPGNNLVVLKALVNGSPVTLLLDTGAQVTMLVPAAAARAGIVVPPDSPRMPLMGVGITSAPLVRVASLQVGDYTVENLLVAVTALPPFPGLHLDGFLGGNFIALFRMTLDSRARELRLELGE
jgi:Aspartyl protease